MRLIGITASISYLRMINIIPILLNSDKAFWKRTMRIYSLGFIPTNELNSRSNCFLLRQQVEDNAITEH